MQDINLFSENDSSSSDSAQSGRKGLALSLLLSIVAFGIGMWTTRATSNDQLQLTNLRVQEAVRAVPASSQSQGLGANQTDMHQMLNRILSDEPGVTWLQVALSTTSGYSASGEATSLNQIQNMLDHFSGDKALNPVWLQSVETTSQGQLLFQVNFGSTTGGTQ